METTPNEIPAEEGMTLETPQEETPEVPMSDLVDGLMKEPEAEEPAQQEPEQTPEQARRAELDAGLNELLEDGWTIDELMELAADNGVRKALAEGKSLMRAAAAYRRRLDSQPSAAPAPKKSVPTVKAGSGAAVKNASYIEEMSSEQFREFMRKAEDAMMMGKNVRID